VCSRNNPNYWHVISRQRNGKQGVLEMPVSLVTVSKGFLCSSIRKKTNDSSDPGMTNGSHWSIGWTTSNALQEKFQTTDSIEECYPHFAWITSKCVTFRKPQFFIVLVTFHEREQSAMSQLTARSELYSNYAKWTSKTASVPRYYKFRVMLPAFGRYDIQLYPRVMKVKGMNVRYKYSIHRL
jgi:hypothetical protein